MNEHAWLVTIQYTENYPTHYNYHFESWGAYFSKDYSLQKCTFKLWSNISDFGVILSVLKKCIYQVLILYLCDKYSVICWYMLRICNFIVFLLYVKILLVCPPIKCHIKQSYTYIYPVKFDLRQIVNPAHHKKTHLTWLDWYGSRFISGFRLAQT